MTDDLKKELAKAVLENTDKNQNKSTNQNVIGNGNVVGNNNVINFRQPEQKKPVIKVVTNPGEEHINESQIVVLKQLVNDIVGLEKITRNEPLGYQSVWSSVNAAGGASKVRLIKVENYEKALNYARKWIGRLSSTKTAKKKDPNWRRRKYAFIKTNMKKYNLEEKLYDLLESKYMVNSLTKLADSELERVYHTVSYWKKSIKNNS